MASSACLLREESDDLFPVRALVPLDPPNAADAEAKELSVMAAALAMVRFNAFTCFWGWPFAVGDFNVNLSHRPIALLSQLWQLAADVRKQYTDAELIEMKR